MSVSEKTKMYILSLGYIENDVALNLLLHNQGTVRDKHKVSDWHRVPSICLLIIHPKLGRILVDTGSHPDAMNGYWPKHTRDSIPLIRKKEDMLDYRLGELNLTPKDIDLLILSHLHLDHAGGLCYFAGTKAGRKVIAHADEIKQALFDTYMSQSSPANGYILSDFYGVEGIRFDPLLESTSLAEDIEIIWLPGHTIGTLGVMVHLENSGTIIFTSDAINAEENIYPETRLSAVFYDSLNVLNTTNKIRWLQRRYNARLIYGHDMNQFKTLPLSPNNYYD